MPAVSDSSPLILYARIGRLALLQELFAEVLIPPAVRREVIDEASGRPGAAEIAGASWIRVRPLEQRIASLHGTPEHDLSVPPSLHAGETEAIHLAVQLGKHVPILLDDWRARQYAYALGRRVFGSAGVLALAKRRHLIPLVTTILDELTGAGLYLRASARAQLLETVGE